jgi:hypothetical protein
MNSSVWLRKMDQEQIYIYYNIPAKGGFFSERADEFIISSNRQT